MQPSKVPLVTPSSCCDVVAASPVWRSLVDFKDTIMFYPVPTNAIAAESYLSDLMVDTEVHWAIVPAHALGTPLSGEPLMAKTAGAQHVSHDRQVAAIPVL